MFNERNYTIFLEDILEAIKKIEKYTNNLSFEDFCSSDMRIDAVIRNFEIIGEAVKKVHQNIKIKYDYVEWKEAAAFRDVLIHHYFGVDLEALWDTINKNIPFFKLHIEKVLQSEKEK